MYNTLLKTVIFPLMETKRGTSQLKCLRFLEKSQWLPPHQLEQLQYTRLKALLNHAYETVPFYRRRFNEAGVKPEDIRSIHQLGKLPKLTKHEIRRNLPTLISRAVPHQKLVESATGGSTGEPLQFFRDKRTISWATAATSRNYRWAGLDIGDKFVVLWGSPFDVSRSQQVSGYLKNLFERNIVLSSSDMSERSMAHYVNIIRRFQPRVIKGYASAFVLLARYVKQQGITDLNIHSAISTAEKLFVRDRALVEKQLNCEVYDTYGCREVAMLAGECQAHAGYHISSETVLLEFVRDGEAVSAGELGEILITDLQNYGMPLIRYSVGDAGEPSDELCACGRGLPLMKSIEGRVTDFIRTADGKNISGPALTLIFSDLNVTRYQIVQRKLNQFRVRVIRDRGYSEADDLKIISRMKALIAPNIEVDVQHVNSIPKSSRSGKHRFILSEVPPFELN